MKKLNFELIGKLQDGTAVSLDKFQEGGTISLIDANGNKTDAPDGDYTFEDGSVATVTNGKISAITSGSPADSNDTSANVPQAQAATDTPADSTTDVTDPDVDEGQDDDLAAQVMALTQTVAQMATDIAALQAAQTQMSTDLTAQKTNTEEQFKAVSIPSATATPNVEDKRTYGEKLVDRLKRLQ